MRIARHAPLIVAICLLPLAAIAASPAGEPAFKVGDQAPTIDPVTWLQGSPVTTFEPGRVYVVEFWATWCPPCISTFPHLSALQQKYSETLTIIGINADGLDGHEVNTDKVREFVKMHREKMVYTVAMEDPVKQSVSEMWVTGTGTYGAPTAGIVDQHGNLVWIGYPTDKKGYTFDKALKEALAGKLHLARSRALQRDLVQATEKHRASKPLRES